MTFDTEEDRGFTLLMAAAVSGSPFSEEDIEDLIEDEEADLDLQGKEGENVSTSNRESPEKMMHHNIYCLSE